jgi:hypothetical protein
MSTSTRARVRGRGAAQASVASEELVGAAAESGRGRGRGRGVVQAVSDETHEVLTPGVGGRKVRAAVESRKSTMELDGSTTRRTSAQVQPDKNDATAAAATAAAAKASSRALQKSRIAEIEDRLRREDNEIDKFAARPDLRMPSVTNPSSIPAKVGFNRFVGLPADDLSPNV